MTPTPDQQTIPGSWADQLRRRFQRRFLLPDGLPALALDGAKRPVDATTSNIGHLLGTGILAPHQERQIAERLLEPDMSSGLGLRTMSSLDGGYNPLSYHCGSVWAHDTAIAILGMTAAGLHQNACRLAGQLLSAAEHFEYQLPELWSGHPNHAIPYPAACRPQAWAAAAALPAINALTSHQA
jgi:glycogen debranching enzyme